MNSIISDEQKIGMIKIAQEFGLGFMVVFGSTAKGKTHAKSDLDIAVMTNENDNSFDLTTKIWSKLVDLFKRDDIEVVDMRGASPVLMRETAVSGKLIYEKARGNFFSWQVYATKIWMETSWLRELERRMLVKWAKS